MFLQIGQVHTMAGPPAARSPCTQAAANALVLFDGARANPGRAKKRSPLEAAEEEVNKAKPFSARLYRIDGPGKKRARVTRGSFGSPEEAALHYAKLLKFEDTKYSANSS